MADSNNPSQLDVVASTFKIRGGGSVGTMFALDVDGRLFYFTAKHVGTKILAKCELAWGDGWKPFPVKLVGHCPDVDITVLTAEDHLPRLLVPKWQSPDTEPDLALGEPTTFFGFPYGWHTSTEGGIPVALMKAGIVSGFYGSKTLDARSSFLIDGHNNPGFSGGPVVAVRKGAHKVAGVVSAYLPADEEVLSPEDKSLIGYSQSNTGIMLASNIGHALDLIKEGAP